MPYSPNITVVDRGIRFTGKSYMKEAYAVVGIVVSPSKIRYKTVCVALGKRNLITAEAKKALDRKISDIAQ